MEVYKVLQYYISYYMLHEYLCFPGVDRLSSPSIVIIQTFRPCESQPTENSVCHLGLELLGGAAGFWCCWPRPFREAMAMMQQSYLKQIRSDYLATRSPRSPRKMKLRPQLVK